MPDLNEMLVFARVVELGSFVGAARLLDLPKATVSRKVQSLEQRLGARLLQRSTRRVEPTEAGRALHAHCVRILEEIEAAEATVSHLHDAPRGVLRVSAPFVLGAAFLAPLLPRFLARHRGVSVDVRLIDSTDTVIASGTDVVLRAGPLPDRRVAYRPLGSFTRMLYAAPSYLASRGEPGAPSDLQSHDALVFAGEDRNGRSAWMLTDGERSECIDVAAVLVANDPAFLVQAALAGRGIAKVPEPLCRDHLYAGRLTRVLPEWSGPSTALAALYPSRHALAPKVRVFLEFLSEQIADATIA